MKMQKIQHTLAGDKIMKMSILLLLIVLVGCDKEDWSTAPSDYKCTAEQHEKAVHEANEARKLDDSGVSWRFYYGHAIIRNCDYIAVRSKIFQNLADSDKLESKPSEI